MPIIGEWAGSWVDSYFGNDYSTTSREINIPPAATFAKAFVSSFTSTANTVALAEITSYRRRLPNGADETIVFPFGETTHEWFDFSVSSVTFSLIIRNSIAHLSWVLEFWE